MLDFGIYGLKLKTKKLFYLKSALSNLTVKFCKNKKRQQKFLNLRPEILYFGIFSLDFPNNPYINFKISPSKLCNWKILETFRNKDAEICLIVKFCENTKMSKFGTKKALFENF